MLLRNRLLVVSSFAILLAVSAAAQATGTTESTSVPPSYPWSYNFPLVGLAFPETLQVNVANRPAAFAAISPVGNCSLCSTFEIPAPATTPPCTGTITFANASGKTIGAPAPFSVAPGQIFSAPLPFSLTGYSGFRGEILASVQGTSTLPSTNLCSLSISRETFDAGTGVTHAFLALPAAGPAVLSGNFSAIAP
jgi:hypothetical protein